MSKLIVILLQIPSSSEAATTKASPVPIPSLECGSIMIILQGEAAVENYSLKRKPQKSTKVKRGDVIYVGSHAQLCFVECSQDLLAYRTFSHEEGPDHAIRNTGAATMPETTRVTVQKKGRAKYLIIDGDAEMFDVETEMDGICWLFHGWSLLQKSVLIELLI